MPINDLANKRSQLLTQTKNLLSVIIDRRQQVIEIFSIKKDLGLNSFDPQQENLVFKLMECELKKLELKELVAFSFIVESQAGAGYPKFSQMEHLSGQKDFQIYYLINPILLRVTHPDLFANVLIHLNFQFKALVEG